MNAYCFCIFPIDYTNTREKVKICILIVCLHRKVEFWIFLELHICKIACSFFSAELNNQVVRYYNCNFWNTLQ